MNVSVLNSISYGVYAIGVKAPDERPSASIVNALIQVMAEPACICVCVNHNNYSNECIKSTGIFTVSVFSETAGLEQIGALGFKSGRDNDKLSAQKYHVDAEGYPVLDENICTWFKCKVIDTSETATHTIFIAEVIEAADELTGTPMTYAYYHTVIKGTAPKNAPHYIKSTPKEELIVKKQVCSVCGYEYDGDTPFDELGDDYVCPVCGVGKDMFEEE